MSNKFSVVLRVKNEERWIGHSLQSVLDKVPNNEVIIIDNNSTDRSLEIASFFKKNVSLEDEGSNYTDVKIFNINEYSPGKALNLGVAQSCNENIIFLSSHCILKSFNEDYIMDKLNDYDAIFGKQIPIYEGKRITPRYIWSHFSDSEVENMYSELEKRYFFHNAFSVTKKSILEKYPFDEELTGKEDRYWAEEIVNKGLKTLYTPELVCDHHYTSNGNTWKGVG
tara:strand:+ start:236 stop:910 length:675 start_codon:yes stop_codon:yes gene_type:complete